MTRYEPTELRCDEDRNVEDVRKYLATIVRRNVSITVDSGELERLVKKKFGIDLAGRLAKIQGLLIESL